MGVWNVYFSPVMQTGLNAMQVALRVLAAITERRPAEPGDLAGLREYAPDANDLAPDELACEVIQRALKHRAALRSLGPD